MKSIIYLTSKFSIFSPPNQFINKIPKSLPLKRRNLRSPPTIKIKQIEKTHIFTPYQFSVQQSSHLMNQISCPFVNHNSHLDNFSVFDVFQIEYIRPINYFIQGHINSFSNVSTHLHLKIRNKRVIYSYLKS